MLLRLPTLLLVVAASLMTLGCGGGGSKTTRVSGKVTYKGAPVTQGHITFVPDSATNSTGTQGSAPIKDGAYDTGSGKNPSSGAVLVRIDGFDGKANPDQPAGNPIFVWEEKADLPVQNSTRDFVVPDKAPKTQPQAKPFINP